MPVLATGQPLLITAQPKHAQVKQQRAVDLRTMRQRSDLARPSFAPPTDPKAILLARCA